ncbi:YsnF/AvaK domain-containing protein [Neobacillus dielmonensis]|uniref:YsnF/AvaK domain-containing protein n=1 Tax=Neobacillus dielmonensis TaxID=1347369 RepID=UPI0005AB207D|nr:YsnF/AvaK domain-containing protein [Neobacillus dielmonensis]
MLLRLKGDFLWELFNFFGDDKQENTNNENNSSEQTTNSTSQTSQDGGTLQLHKEELDVTKNNVDAGEVVLSKEVVEEQKTVDVPVMHEEVVIKRTPLNQKSNESVSSGETIHIPVSQEQVQVNKYTVETEEISASKRQVEETQQVQETLKHEEAHVNTTGSVNIVSDDTGFEDINS